MTRPRSDADHSAEVIEDYLEVALLAIDTKKPGGGIHGYSAALLLLCAVDAIGRGLGAAGGGKARLEVLNRTEFGQSLSVPEIDLLRDLYRNPLTHQARLGSDRAFMSPDADGAAFEFRAGKLALIRVPVLYRVVRDVFRRAILTP
jgi:hypothetical protein